jgi:hypothetical protein
MAIYSRNSVYSGGSGGGYGGSFSYSGGQNWTWSDPNLSTYDAHALSEIRITPNGPAEIGPVMFRSTPNVAAGLSRTFGTSLSSLIIAQSSF